MSESKLEHRMSKQELAEKLIRWANARDRRNPDGHGKTGTQLLRDAAVALSALDEGAAE